MGHTENIQKLCVMNKNFIEALFYLEKLSLTKMGKWLGCKCGLRQHRIFALVTVGTTHEIKICGDI